MCFFSKKSRLDRLSVRLITHLGRYYAVSSMGFMYIFQPLAWAVGFAYV